MVVGCYLFRRKRRSRRNGVDGTIAGHSGLSYLHIALALGFFVFAMEEIIWGQRILGFGTPAAQEGVNQQDETTIHNLPELAIIIFFALFWGSVAALAGGVAPGRSAVS